MNLFKGIIEGYLAPGEITISSHLALRPLKYRDRLNGLYVVARSLFLPLLTCSARPCLGPA